MAYSRAPCVLLSSASLMWASPLLSTASWARRWHAGTCARSCLSVLALSHSLTHSLTHSLSSNRAGVTRSMQWLRLGGAAQTASPAGSIELLDSPGIIPAQQLDQRAAVKLAICNDIGEASYDNIVVATLMVDMVNEMRRINPSFVDSRQIAKRYGTDIPFFALSGEDVLFAVAEKYYHGDALNASQRLLGDFRRGFMGTTALEAPLWAAAKQMRAEAEGLVNVAKVERSKEEVKEPVYEGW